MNKKYFFLAGMQRSGNTVLSNILSQNQDFYVSPFNGMAEYLWRVHNVAFENDWEKINPQPDRRNKMISQMMDNYYEDVEQKIIIDRSKSWAVPSNIDVIKKYIDPNPKIIFTIRKLEDCIASLVRVNRKYYKNLMAINNFRFQSSLSENDNIALYLMKYGDITNLYNYSKISLFNENYSKHILVIRYEDLVQFPKDVLDDIYSFLEIDPFDHNFNNIDSLQVSTNLNSIGFPEDLHQTRPSITDSDTRPEDLFSQKIIEDIRFLDTLYR